MKKIPPIITIDYPSKNRRLFSSIYLSDDEFNLISVISIYIPPANVPNNTTSDDISI